MNQEAVRVELNHAHRRIQAELNGKVLQDVKTELNTRAAVGLGMPPPPAATVPKRLDSPLVYKGLSQGTLIFQLEVVISPM